MSKPSEFSFPAMPTAAVEPGQFIVAAAFLEHVHIYLQCAGLVAAGAIIKWVFDPDPEKMAAFRKQHPTANAARSLDEILEDGTVHLIAAAAVPNERSAIGRRIMRAGKDYFCDKAPFTTIDQLDETRNVVKETGRKYFVYYSERIHVESAIYAGYLVQSGAIGNVIQVLGLGPHRIGDKAKRPSWFFERSRSGGILCDIGSHQVEQFLFYSRATDAYITQANVGNLANSDTPEFEDFGEASLVGNNGSSSYFRVDWFTPDGLSTWGDGRLFILGTEGNIEVRKYVDIGRKTLGDQLYLVNDRGEYHLNAAGKVGFPFFRELILDCLNRSEHAMTQAHAFKAAEISLKCQATARRLAL